MRIPELLVPASSLEVLQVAVIFGADAVYVRRGTVCPRTWCKSIRHS